LGIFYLFNVTFLVKFVSNDIMNLFEVLSMKKRAVILLGIPLFGMLLTGCKYADTASGIKQTFREWRDNAVEKLDNFFGYEQKK